MVIFSKEEFEDCTVSRKRSELTKRLIELTKKNGYEIIQTNGQRVYAPPASRNIRPPPKGCEIFIGKLHKNIFEDELIPLFEKIGPLYKFRLMLDFTENTRGYAFATYFRPQDANKAVAKLNNYEMRPKLHIGVYKSVDNCRLFIGNLPEDKTKEDVVEMLSKYVDGITNVIMYPNYEKPWLSRGFVFVEFQTHRLAAMARRQFAPDNLIAWGQRMHVDWADPLPEVDPKIMTKVTVLYLRNVPFKYTEAEVHTCVCSVVGSRIVTKLHKMLNYAFVHFSNRSDAEFAKQKLQNFVIGNRLIEVEWAIPRRFSKKNRLNCGPNNFCTSVPPNMRRLVQQRLKSLDSPSRCSSVLSYEKKSKQCESVSDILSRMSLQGSSKSYVETSSYISDEITSGTWSSDATDNFYHGNASSYIPDEISSEAWGLDSNESYYAIDKTGQIPDKMSSQACALMFTESGGPLDYFNGYNFVNHTF